MWAGGKLLSYPIFDMFLNLIFSVIFHVIPMAGPSKRASVLVDLALREEDVIDKN
jgi:hypothetical protein